MPFRSTQRTTIQTVPFCKTSNGNVFFVFYCMPAAVRLGDEWLLRYGSARFATTSQVSPPLCVSSRQANCKAAGSVFEILYYVIVIDHFLAYMHIRRGYKIYTRVGDFDPPTHQPTNMYIYFLNIALILLCRHDSPAESSHTRSIVIIIVDSLQTPVWLSSSSSPYMSPRAEPS